MTQPKRDDEIAFYAALKAATEEARALGINALPSWGGARNCKALARELGINEKRAFYLLQKWADKGWIEYGVWAWGGWFTETSPSELTK